MDNILTNLEALIQQEKDYQRPLDEVSWNGKLGILITANDAEIIVYLLKEFKKLSKFEEEYQLSIVERTVLDGFRGIHPFEQEEIDTVYKRTKSFDKTVEIVMKASEITSTPTSVLSAWEQLDSIDKR